MEQARIEYNSWTSGEPVKPKRDDAPAKESKVPPSIFMQGRVASKETCMAYARLVDIFIEWLHGHHMDIYDVDQLTVQAFMDFQKNKDRKLAKKKAEAGEKPKKGIKIYAVHNYVKAIKKFYDILIEREEKKDEPRITKNPCAKIKGPPRRDPKVEARKAKHQTLTIDESKALLDILQRDKSEKGLQRLAIVFTLFRTGLRASELCGMKFDNIVFTSGKSAGYEEITEKHIPLELQFIGKGNKEGTVKFPRDLLDAVMAYHRAGPVEHEFLFYATPTTKNPTRRPLNRFQLYEIIREVGALVGKPDFHPHSTRHTFGTTLVLSGCPIHLVQTAMRHSSVNTTINIYCHDERNPMDYFPY